MEYDQIQTYLIDLVPERPPEMRVMEAYAEETGFPIIGPSAGYQCYQIARMIGARQIFEMGSGYGYSTAWFAKAVQENGGGTVHHVVWDADLSKRATRHLTKLGYDGMIEYHVSEAAQTLENTPGPFDLIFIDIEKDSYATSLPIIAERLRPGGVLIADNALWSGRIFDPTDTSAGTLGILQLTRTLTNDPDWITTIVPVRDGLAVAYKA